MCCPTNDNSKHDQRCAALLATILNMISWCAALLTTTLNMISWCTALLMTTPNMISWCALLMTTGFGSAPVQPPFSHGHLGWLAENICWQSVKFAAFCGQPGWRRGDTKHLFVVAHIQYVVRPIGGGGARGGAEHEYRYTRTYVHTLYSYIYSTVYLHTCT
jgi:hypothetical protein